MVKMRTPREMVKKKREKFEKNRKRKNPKKSKKEKSKRLIKEEKKKKNLFSVVLDKICVFCLYPILDSQQYVKRGS